MFRRTQIQSVIQTAGFDFFSRRIFKHRPLGERTPPPTPSTPDPFNPLEPIGNYSATSNNMKLVHWPLTGGCYIWHSEEGTGLVPIPPRPLVAVPQPTHQRPVYRSPCVIRCCTVLMWALKG